MPITVGGTSITFNDGTTQSTAAVPGGSGSQTFVSSGTFTVPAGITLVKATVVGGGGGGANGFTVVYTQNAGANGGAGGISAGYVTVTPSSAITVTVGAGGAGSNGGAGAAGGTSSFGSVLSATGGGGGSASPGESRGADGAVGVGSGSNRNTALSTAYAIYTRPRGAGTAAVAYSIGNTYGAGANGTGEFGSGGNNASGGMGGVVLVEW